MKNSFDFSCITKESPELHENSRAAEGAGKKE